MWKHLGAVHPCCHIKKKVTDDTLLCQFGSLQNIWHTTHILTLFPTHMEQVKVRKMFMDRSSWFRCNDATVFDINRWHFYGGRCDVLPSSHTADWTTAAENNSVMDQSPAERTWLTTEHIFSKEKLACLANQHFCSYNVLEKRDSGVFCCLSQLTNRKVQIIAVLLFWSGIWRKSMTHWWNDSWEVLHQNGNMTSCTCINCGVKNGNPWLRLVSLCMLMSEQWLSCLMTHCSNNGTLLIAICVQPPPQQHWLATGSSISTNTLQKKKHVGNGVKTM